MLLSMLSSMLLSKYLYTVYIYIYIHIHIHIYTNPDPGCEKIRFGSETGSRENFDTDLDQGKKDTDPDLDPAKRTTYHDNV